VNYISSNCGAMNETFLSSPVHVINCVGQSKKGVKYGSIYLHAKPPRLREYKVHINAVVGKLH